MVRRTDLVRLWFSLTLAVVSGWLPAYGTTLISFPFAGRSADQSPQASGWFLSGVSGPEQSVAGASGDATPAWRVTDAQVAGPSALYVAVLSSNDTRRAREQGWRLTASVRLTQAFGAGASLGIGAFFDDRGYLAALDRSPNGELRAELFDDANPFLRRSPPLAPDSDFYDIELRFDPATRLVSFLFEGEVFDAWDGAPTVTAGHPNLVQFGVQYPGGAGEMDFRHVTFSTIDPAAEQGDYNGDGFVNAADYTVWRDQRESGVVPPFGLDLAGDGNRDRMADEADYRIWESHYGHIIAASASVATPEPSGTTLAAVLTGGLLAARIK